MPVFNGAPCNRNRTTYSCPFSIYCFMQLLHCKNLGYGKAPTICTWSEDWIRLDTAVPPQVTEPIPAVTPYTWPPSPRCTLRVHPHPRGLRGTPSYPCSPLHGTLTSWLRYLHVVDPGAAEFSRRIFDVRRKSAGKFGLAAIRRRRKKIWRMFSAAVLKCRG